MKRDSVEVINISCFGAIRPLKNHLLQAMAAIEFANRIGFRLRFHINATRKELGGEPILKNLVNLFYKSPEGHELVTVDWLDHPHFLKYIHDEIDIGMQVSFTETYNIVAADHVQCNKLIITSAEVPFVSSFFYADPTSFRNMADKLIWTWKTRLLGLQRLNKFKLANQNKDAIRAWDIAFNHL